jgi:hypothetical protein
LQRREQFLQGVLELHKLRDPGQQRAAWRGTIASIARACSEDLPSPLEGLAPAAVVDSLRVALATGLIDDLDWLSAASAGAALYEIAAALPAGNEKREVGRRVLGRLLEGDATAFAALATRMALGSSKGLSGEGVRARVALCMALPPSQGVRVEQLAYALLSRRELARVWVGERATGALADRRLAGRLIEQAARAVARRVAEGDDRALALFRGEAVGAAWRRLLEDREPLVWRHVAIARGLLASSVPAHLQALEAGLAPDLSPTEWRRSATALTALGAVRPDHAWKLLRETLSRGLLRRDPGATAALLWGIPAAAEVEPELASDMLDAILEVAPPLTAAEAMPELLAHGPGGSFGRRALDRVRDLLVAAGPSSSHGAEIDDGATALRARVLSELRPVDERERSLAEVVSVGLRFYAEGGAREAFQYGLEALALLEGALGNLEALDEASDAGRAGALARRTAFASLREIDAGLLEDGLVRDLLVLGLRSPEAQRALEGFDASHDRLARWLLDREQQPTGRTEAVPHKTLRLIRLRSVLRLADARHADDRDESVQGARQRCLRLANLMLRHLVTKPPPPLFRTICAAYARAVDALLRDDGADPADVLLVMAHRGLDRDVLATVREASMDVDLHSLLDAYLALLNAVDGADGPPTHSSSGPASIPPPGSSPPPPLTPLSRKIEAISALTGDLAIDHSTRFESLRGSLVRLARALTRLYSSSSLSEVAGVGKSESSPLQELESSVTSVAQLCLGARQRLEDRANADQNASFSLSLSTAIDAAIGGTDVESLTFAVALSHEELAIVLPPALADIVCSILDTLLSLPAVASIIPAVRENPEPPLPAWLPRRRTLGGFYVVRALGSGTGGTVFMARRIEDRATEKSEHFALKVPDYDGNAARTLSEGQFLQLFREEATALLGLPQHPNLARFVTFDLASRPKPILVMELVEGPSLERMIASGALETDRVFAILDGVLAGLEQMHRAGIGHLDVKPSNVILRQGREPVLVDFGLSGRHIRPGCATLSYGAPEIWGLVPADWKPIPQPADMYAFGCMAYEILTSHDLFDAASEMALIATHMGHDGWPGPLRRMATDPALRDLADAIARTLRRDPRQRISCDQLRAVLRLIAPRLAGRPWPLMPRVA